MEFMGTDEGALNGGLAAPVASQVHAASGQSQPVKSWHMPSITEMLDELPDMWWYLSCRVETVGLRMIFWALALAFASFPALAASDGAQSFHISDLTEKITEHGAFPDLFYVAITAAAISVTSLLDSKLRRLKKLGPLETVGVFGSLAYYLVLFVYGTHEFEKLLKLHDNIPPPTQAAAMSVVLTTIYFGTVVEVWIGVTWPIERERQGLNNGPGGGVV